MAQYGGTLSCFPFGVEKLYQMAAYISEAELSTFHRERARAAGDSRSGAVVVCQAMTARQLAASMLRALSPDAREAVSWDHLCALAPAACWFRLRQSDGVEPLVSDSSCAHARA